MKRNRRFLLLSILIGGLISLLIWPWWPLRLQSRPLFHHWVGASGEAWGLNLPLVDKHGTWCYFDFELNVVAVLVEGKPGVEPYPPRCTSVKATFPAEPYVTIERNKDCLLLITKDGIITKYELRSDESQQIYNLLFEKTDQDEGANYLTTLLGRHHENK